jgi:hypothetical protein
MVIGDDGVVRESGFVVGKIIDTGAGAYEVFVATAAARQEQGAALQLVGEAERHDEAVTVLDRARGL